MTEQFLIAGFGGQGVLFAGKQLAKTAMYKDLQVSWLPSYGPEMRGGAANCSVIISDKEIGSPIVTAPTVLIAFNLPSFEKFEPSLQSGGLLIADSSLIEKRSSRKDLRTCYIPATAIASDNELHGGANVIMLGKLLNLTSIFKFEEFEELMIAGIPASKEQLIANNKKALRLGYDWKE